MTFHVFKGGVAKVIGPAHVAKGGVWKVIARIRIWKVLGNPPLGAWHDLYAGAGPPPPPPPPPVPSPPPPPPVVLTVAITPTEVSGTRIGHGTVYTNICQATITNGTPPYTYTWSRVSYSGSIIPAILVNVTDNSKAQFSRDMEGTVPEEQTSRMMCIAQDSKGNTGQAYVTADFFTARRDLGDWTNTGGGGAIP